MAQKTDKSKRVTGLPMDEPIMVRYSPHHEFPLSTVISGGLHVLVIFLLVIGGILVAKLNWGGEAKMPESNAVAFEQPAGGGGGNPNGVGNGPGDGATGDPEAPDAPLEDDQPVVVGQREQLQEAKKELLQLDDFKDEEGKRLIEEGGKEVTKILNLKSDVRKKLNSGLAAGKGQGGSGSGGGRGGSRGTGTGDDVGPGSGDAKRAERPLRWTLIFNTRDGKDYRKQLQAFGAILAIPDPKSADGYLVIRDLDNPKPQAEDIAQIKRIYWIDDKPASVRSLSAALDMPPPGHFIVFFPREFEDKLLRLELGYRGKQENEITETRFEVRRFEGTYEPYVISQR
jgi:hypothetical protein